MFKKYINNYKAKRFGRKYRSAIKRLGGIEHSTIEFKNKVLDEIKIENRVRNGEIRGFVIGFVLSFIASLLIAIAQHHKYL